jgi:hypothetical protein
MFLAETENFCATLGLKTHEVLEQLAKAAEEAVANGETPETTAEQYRELMAQLNHWTGGEKSGCTILINESVQQMRMRILGVKQLTADAGVQDDTGEPVTEEVGHIPRFADGTECLVRLKFEDEWLEQRCEKVRRTIFVQLGESREHLDRVDVDGAVEELRRQLDHRLRKHTNRKGAVQVDYYLPRYSTISKHKDKYERHLVEIAKKAQGHKVAFGGLVESIPEMETAYNEDLDALTERFGEAGTLPMLTAIQREAIDKEAKFAEACKRIRDELKSLAVDAPEKLKRENESFTKTCMVGQAQAVKFAADEDDQSSPLLKYSAKEVAFYAGEIAELDRALDEQAATRQEDVTKLSDRLQEMRQTPFKNFIEKWEQASEELCRSKGFGTVHGEPRRKAQERVRTLYTWGADARNRIGSVCDYLAALSELPVEDVGDPSSLPPFQIFRLRDQFVDKERPWVFTAELLGTFSALVCSLDCLGTHLDAFQDTYAPKYKLDNIKLVRILEEAELTCADGDDNGKNQEQALRQLCVGKVIGPLFGCDNYNSVIKSIVNTAKERYKEGLPSFMETFLNDMQESAEKTRMDGAMTIRERCDELRETTLLQLGGALFGELASRSMRQLRARAEQAKAITLASWAESDELREAHERALNPKLANPNNEKELVALVNHEADRCETALSMVVEDRARMAQLLRVEADAFVRRLSARFEVALALVDALPLHSQFMHLPGDEQVEAPRMSIKRRLRKMQSGQPMDSGDGSLPARSWNGVPSHELRCLLRGGTWPDDAELAGLGDEQLSERTPAVSSFRSPLHRDLYNKRNEFYKRFMEHFSVEVDCRSGELTARENKERVGDRTWNSMVRQLNPEAVEGALEARRLIAEEKAAAEQAAADAAAAAAAPGKKK